MNVRRGCSRGRDGVGDDDGADILSPAGEVTNNGIARRGGESCSLDESSEATAMPPYRITQRLSF